MKKLTNFWIISLVLTVLVGFSSCSKDDDDDTAKDPTSILTSKVWVVAEDGIKPEGGDAASQFAALFAAALLEPGEFGFKANNVFDYTVLGFPATGTWALSSDFKSLTVKDEDGELISSYEIVEASASVVKLKRKYTKAELETTSDVTVLFTLKPKA